MGRFGSVIPVIILLILAVALSGCGSKSTSTSTQSTQVPTVINLAPNPNVSLEVGKTMTFTGTPEGGASTAITEAVDYQSSNTTVLTISTTGLACAGSWDSLSAPTTCTPGPVGTAQVTATVEGVSSAPTTVYVHQHIDSITVSPTPGQTPPTDAACFSVGQTFNYQATATSGGADITSTVGIFTWQAVTDNVATLVAATQNNTVNGLLAGQVQITANTPGITPIFASLNDVTSVPFNFNTCPVQSITLMANGNSGNPINITTTTPPSITATVFDTQGRQITGSFLTWCSSQPEAVTVSGAGTNCNTIGGNTVSVTGQTAGGGSTITASCTPPTCNIGLLPTLPIYAENVVLAVSIPAATTTSTSTSTSLYVSSTDCGTMDGCISTVVPITVNSGAATSTTAASTVGGAALLPATPNSFVFNRQGTKAYLGTDRSELNTKGLMIFDPTADTATQNTSVAGKVLAVSPDGTKVILSDTVDIPNQVFIFDTGTSAAVAYPITGATAADFSPDNLKAYILAGSTLYVYSKLEALQTFTLNATASDAAFLGNGALGYMAGGDPAGVSFRATCDDSSAAAIGSVSVPGATLIRALPDGKTMLALTPPNIQTFTASITGTLTPGEIGCPAPRGALTVTNTPNPPVGLGQGNLVPTQLLVSSDGAAAYILTSGQGRVLVFNILGGTTSAITLTPNAIPLQASLSLNGVQLLVGADDGSIHVLDTQSGADIQQITFPQNLPGLQTGICANVTFTCLPNLVAVKP